MLWSEIHAQQRAYHRRRMQSHPVTSVYQVVLGYRDVALTIAKWESCLSALLNFFDATGRVLLERECHPNRFVKASISLP